MKNIYNCISVVSISKAMLIGLFTILPNIISAQQLPSIQSGVSFQWSDTQTSNNDPATIQSIIIDGTEYSNYVVATKYELTRLGPDGHDTNRIMLNGATSINDSSTANWNTNALSAFQDKNLNHYFTTRPNGRDICLDFNAAVTTDAQKQSIYYNPALTTNQEAILAITEQGGDDCFYIEIWGIATVGGPEQKLGSTFVRSNGAYTGCSFGTPNAGSDYWKSGRCNDNNQTIGIALFQLRDLAPAGSKITKIELVGASRNHGDGKLLVFQNYAENQESTNCIDEGFNGNVDLVNNVPENSTYSLISEPSPAGQSFSFNSDGTYNYVPNPGFNGTVTFEYEVCLPNTTTPLCDTATVTIDYTDLPPMPEGTISCDSGDDNFTITVTSPLGSEYQYALNGSAFQDSPVFNNLTEGSYSLSVQSALSTCINESNTPIVLENLDISGSVTDVLCNSGNTGAIDVTISGGTPPYIFEWNNGSTSQDLSDISSGTYNVIVTDANGCTASNSFTINQPSEALTSAIAAVNVVCNGDSNGSIDFNVIGGTAPYTFSWNNGETTEDLINLAAGTYSVTATDANGCTTTNQISVEEPNQTLSADIINITNVDCDVDSSGSFSVEASGGNAPYTYSIDNGITNQNNGLFDNLSEGTYTILITDINGCSYNLESTITKEDIETPVITVPSSISIEGCTIADLNVVNAVFPLSTVESGDIQSTFLSNPDYNASDNFAILSITYIDTVISTGNCPITVSRTFTIKDSCDNTTSVTQTITVEDTIPPTINVPSDVTIECTEDESSANTGSATGSDNCSSVSITQSDIETDGPCGNTKTIVRTWTATDECGNTTSANQTITIEDTRPPILTLPADVIIECGDDTSSATTGLAKAEDDCGGVTISESDFITPGCGNTQIIIRTWTTTDNCGNSASGTQTITVEDTTPPSLNIPADVNVECNDDTSSASTGEATAIDSCGSVTITQSDAEIVGTCGNTKTIVRTWTATDECGNTTSADQSITVEDTTPPSIDDSSLENINVQCGITPDGSLEAWLTNNAGATATDTCGAVTWSNNFESITDVDCASSPLDVIFTATDECGNAASITATYSIIDNLAPIIEVPSDVILECNEDTSPNNTGEATASDDCSIPTLDYSDTEVSNCGNTKIITRTWTATDACGNITSEDQIITIQDTTPPTFSVPTDITIECGIDTTDVTITGDVTDESDNCSTDLNAIFSDTIADGACPTTSVITRTWSLTDDCNNTTSLVQIITIQDTTPPSFTVPSDITIECDIDPTDLSITGDVTDENDNCSTELEATFSDSEVEGSCPNTAVITRTWTLTDDCNNSSSLVQTITVQDTTPPSFSVPANITIECDVDATDLNITGDVSDENDNCSTNLEASYTDSIVDGTCPNLAVITRTWSLTDDCNNTTTQLQTITVADTTAPTLFVPADIILECNDDTSSDTAGEATGTDTCGTVIITQTDIETTSCGNTKTIIRTWTATDECGNSTSADQTITVQDTTPPVIDPSGIENINIQCGITPDGTLEAWLANNAGTTANDACGDVSWSNDYDLNTGANCSDNPITVTFTVTDDCGNSATISATYSIIDEQAPTLTIPENVTIECGEDVSPINTGEANAIDDCSTHSVTYSDTEIANCGSTKVITRTWTAEDSCGNTTSADQIITVEDTIAPTFSVPADVFVECDVDITDLTITGDVTDENDNCSSELNATFTDSFVDGSCPNSSVITRTWSLTDDCNNNTTLVQTITVQDTTPPSFNEELPTDLEAECDTVPEVPTLTATDNCGESNIAFNETITSGSCVGDYIIERTWTAADSCGNENIHTQIITVQDNTAPTLVTSFDENITVTCDGLPEVPSLVFEDSCSNNIDVSFNEVSSQTNEFDDYTVTRTWLVTDDCGNIGEFTQTITVEFNNVITPLDTNLCVLDEEIDLFNLLSGDFSLNGEWSVVSGDVIINGSLFDPASVEVGVYTFKYSITEEPCPAEVEVTITIDDDCVVLACGQEDVVISKTVTANGDGFNEFFTITGIEDCDFVIELQIFNRWGAEIYKSNNYQNDWHGESHSSSIGSSGKVPSGTYYYIINVKDSGLAPFTGPIYVATN